MSCARECSVVTAPATQYKRGRELVPRRPSAVGLLNGALKAALDRRAGGGARGQRGGLGGLRLESVARCFGPDARGKGPTTQVTRAAPSYVREPAGERQPPTFWARGLFEGGSEAGLKSHRRWVDRAKWRDAGGARVRADGAL